MGIRFVVRRIGTRRGVSPEVVPPRLCRDSFVTPHGFARRPDEPASETASKGTLLLFRFVSRFTVVPPRSREHLSLGVSYFQIERHLCLRLISEG